MRQSTCDSWITIMRRHVDDYRRAAGLSHEAMAMQMVDAWERLGRPTIGDDFIRHRDIFATARVAWQRIGRWLDDNTKSKTLLPASFVPVVLAVLPEDRRLRAINDLLGPIGFVAEPRPDGGDAALAFSHTLSRLCKEAGEASSAMAKLTDGATGDELESAEKELQDALSVTMGALHQVQAARAKQH